VNPRYVGTDERDRRYVVTARDAALDPLDPDSVALTQPEAEVELGGGALRVEAGSGLYRRDAQTLDLADGITLRAASGYRVRTSTAHVDLDEGMAGGDDAVAGDGPLGTLEARGFEIRDGGSVITFGGRVRVVVTPEEQQAHR
jgi:lipopolysaccharide export system protein LptC